ncbi:hypothetical protein T492DRAFT_889435 [Pavlovales sp. CCMP2436]|nr:hypothetical protein T492DRAFT_889435 [Pavlovales sp. CCMP2436]
MVGSTYFAVMAGGLGSNKLLVRQLEKAPALRDAFFVCGVPTEILSTSVTRFTFMFSDFIDGCLRAASERYFQCTPRERAPRRASELSLAPLPVPRRDRWAGQRGRMPRTTFAPDGTPPEITGTPPESRTLSGLPYAQCFASLSALPAAYAEEEIFALIDAHDASASALFTEKEAQAMPKLM